MYEDILKKLAQSKFRSSFHLKAVDREYIAKKGLEVIESHAKDFIAKRIAVKNPPHDGKQTPMRGHPVFIAQHATACCCRGCINKWHKLPLERELSAREQEYLVGLIMCWIKKEIGLKSLLLYKDDAKVFA